MPELDETPDRPSRVPLIAVSILLLLSAVATFMFYGNWRDTERRAQAAELASSVYEKDSFRVSNMIQKTKGDRDVVADPAYKLIVLRGGAKAAGAVGLLFYNSSARDLFLDIRRLPEAPAGKQYQLWAMGAGAPGDAGVVNADKLNEGLLKMNPVSSSTSFLLTLEKTGGAANPTTAETYLSGAL